MLDLTYTAPKPRVIAGAKHDWELVIGLEVHAQVATAAKLFSGASTLFGAEPNSNVAFVDPDREHGIPGGLFRGCILAAVDQTRQHVVVATDADDLRWHPACHSHPHCL